jgi:ribosomal protein S18 acetylase RimI-like enzyme
VAKHDLLIRSARYADAAPLAGLYAQAWHNTYRGIIPALELERMIVRRDAAWWSQSVARAPGRLLVASFMDRPVGYANLGPSRARLRHHGGEIYELYLVPECQGVGFGGQLFRAARRRLNELGCAGHLVWALKDNHGACAFYRRQGGKRIAATRQTFGSVKLHKLAFSWR